MKKNSTASPSQTPRPGHPGIEQRLLNAWKQRDAPPNSTLLLAFSGGPDSLALALALSRVAPLAGFSLTAIHVDHRLRTRSNSEAESAMALAREVGLACRVETLPRDPTLTHQGVGVEEAARRERYAVLARRASELGAAYVVTAHHQNDQAETVLLHLLRGAGLAGAAGMASVSVLNIPWWPNAVDDQMQIRVWRPWLAEAKDQIAAYRKRIAASLNPVADPSNEDTTLLRNRLRQDVFPVIETVRPGSVAALARFGRLAAMDDQLLKDLAVDADDRLDRSADGLRLDELATLPEPLLRRILRLELENGVTDLTPSADRIEALVEAIHGERGNICLQLGEGVSAVVSKHRLIFKRDEQ